jgi:hypothetical protein
LACPSKVDDLAVEEASAEELEHSRLTHSFFSVHYSYLLRRNDSERQRFFYRDNGKRVFPRRKFVEVDSKRDDLFSGHWI